MKSSRWFLFLQPMCLAYADSSFEAACRAFDPTSHLNNATLRLHEYLPANTTILLPGIDPSCSRYNQTFTAEACRFALTIPTSNRSSFIYEMILPNTTTWSGRYMATGNGGIDGCIKYEDMAYGLSHGFAVTGTNNGHNGTGGEAFLNNEDVIIDFSYRALHNATEAAKTLIEAFYGNPANKSYYLGCSGGGRQGMQAASLYPEDYDGVVIGAPALNFNYMSTWRASFYNITGPANSTGFITKDAWTGLIHDEILRQCDMLDGVDDGILADPSLCAAIFRPEALLCSGDNTTDCLSPKQVEAVRRVYSPLYGTSGQLIYPGLSPGAELQAVDRLLAGTPFPYSVDWFRYAVFSDPSWSPDSWSIADADVAEKINPGNARTWPSDLSPFRDAGGKLLIYQGGSDNQITHFDTQRWYNYLSTSMDATSADLDNFTRFFVVSGMAHCSGGIGAWQIGQNAAGAKGVSPKYDPESNVLAALVQWVEKDQAPDEILGTKFVNDTASLGVALTRRHCRYPLRETYLGGNASSADSWTCR
ncbi:putative feruloyl esterase B-2 [Cyphellophora attinorum]|uniref:Carboxylic ester hydrolase n=1 Tax=Cyphellophora attinorum TaxID=1664694 RepID=A0A0N0NPH6_9EURO|nr:putative feruloyl esterase B-2 [Phialophora attinorum]KPI42761.1 putative feruloyl esterase B-2 [Phialophora attinorum]